MPDRTINFGDDAADARYRIQDTSSTGGDFVVAEDLDGGTVLLEYDYSASEWVSRGPVNLTGNDITNAGSITADTLEADDRIINNVGVAGYLSADQSINADTPTKVAYDTVRDDDQNEFDTSAHEFTAADDGDYAIFGQVETNGGSSGDFLRLTIMVNGTRERRSQEEGSGEGSSVSVNTQKLNLSAGDTVYFIFENTSSSDTLSGLFDRSYFEITQVG